MAKRNWLDGLVGNTPITAARLNELEDDVVAAASSGGATVTADPENPGLYFIT